MTGLAAPIAAPSPNFNERRAPISMIVLHYTGMETGEAAMERLRSPDFEVSAHYVVEEDGRLFQLVEEEKRAWHAGLSCWKGERDVNSASIGIEIVNGGHDFGLPGFPDAQIETVLELVGDIAERRGILAENIIGHADVAPGRKQDPGERFPWRRLVERGLSLWPDDRPARGLELEEALDFIGYDLSAGREAVIEAFQRRFRPFTVTGEDDAITTGAIFSICAQTLAAEPLTLSASSR